MSWDDIEVKASDIVGSDELPEHPIQLFMSADRVVWLGPAERLSRDYRCKHAGPYDYIRGFPDPAATATLQEFSIKLHGCCMHVPFYVRVPVPMERNDLAFTMEERLIHRASLWKMGLCSCGTLYVVDCGWTEIF